MSCRRFHKFNFLTNPYVPHIPNWVQEFYTTYEDFVPQRKTSDVKFKMVDYVVVRGKKVLCDRINISSVLECIYNIFDVHRYRVKTKSLDTMKICLAPFICDGTLRWLEAGSLIKKKDLHVVARLWFGFIT